MVALAIFVTILIISIALAYFISLKTELLKYKTQISFKESMDLMELPIITLRHKGVKLNFLLDTGSNDSFISNSAFDLLGVEGTDYSTGIAGHEGVIELVSKKININLKYKKYKYTAELIVSPTLDESFTALKEHNGIQIHGLLGTRFLEEHQYILDFAELVARNK